MDYIVEYHELERVTEKTVSKINKTSSAAEKLQSSWNSLCQLKSFQGNAAEAVRDYVQNVHFQLLQALLLLLKLYRERISIYQGNYFSEVDQASNTIIKKQELTQIKNRLTQIEGEIHDTRSSLLSALADFVNVCPGETGIADNIRKAIARAQNYGNEALDATSKTDNKVVEYENAHREDLKEVQLLIERMRHLIDRQLGANRISPDHYGAHDHNSITFSMELLILKMAMVDASKAYDETHAEYQKLQVAKLVEKLKDAKIARMEEKHPEYKKEFDEFFKDKGFSDREIRDIKYKVYTAPEPYRSIYLEHLSDIKIGNYDLSQSGSFTAYYNQGSESIFLSGDESTYNCKKGPYDTFFHEYGHGIDDFEVNGVRYKTGDYVYNGKTFNDILVDDVRNKVRQQIMTYTTDEETIEQIMRSLNLTDDASFQYQDPASAGSAYANSIRDQVISDIKQGLGGVDNGSASDVYGGVTNNVIAGDWGHWTNGYWYKNGVSTQSQGKELWAEFYAAQMTQDEAKLQSIREHFPQAYAAMEQMAKDMAASK